LLTAKLLKSIVSVFETTPMDIDTAENEGTVDIMKKENAIKLPIHVIRQLRMVNAEIEEKSMDVAIHKHKDGKAIKDIMEDKPGVLIIDGSSDADPKHGNNKGNVQKIMKIERVGNDLETPFVFAVMMKGRKKIHCHIFGNVGKMMNPIMAINKKLLFCTSKMKKTHCKTKDNVKMKSIPRNRAKMLVSGLLTRVVDRSGSEDSIQVGKQGKDFIQVPQHFMGQLRRALGKGQQPQLETAVVAHDNIDQIAEVIKKDTGIMIYKTNLEDEEKMNHHMEIMAMKTGEVLEMMNEKKMETLVFVSFIRGMKKMHLHFLGEIPKGNLIAVLKTDDLVGAKKEKENL